MNCFNDLSGQQSLTGNRNKLVTFDDLWGLQSLTGNRNKLVTFDDLSGQQSLTGNRNKLVTFDDLWELQSLTGNSNKLVTFELLIIRNVTLRKHDVITAIPLPQLCLCNLAYVGIGITKQDLQTNRKTKLGNR